MEGNRSKRLRQKDRMCLCVDDKRRWVFIEREGGYN